MGLLHLKGRVTRLGEFSPIVLLFTLDTFLNFTEEAQTFGRLFLHYKLCVKLGKKSIGLHFGRN
jgi:hypothetical protein